MFEEIHLVHAYMCGAKFRHVHITLDICSTDAKTFSVAKGN